MRLSLSPTLIGRHTVPGCVPPSQLLTVISETTFSNTSLFLAFFLLSQLQVPSRLGLD